MPGAPKTAFRIQAIDQPNAKRGLGRNKFFQEEVFPLPHTVSPWMHPIHSRSC